MCNLSIKRAPEKSNIAIKSYFQRYKKIKGKPDAKWKRVVPLGQEPHKIPNCKNIVDRSGSIWF